MKIWLMTVGETLPTESKDARVWRTGMLAAMLAKSGHDVTWWTSSLHHASKKQRSLKNTTEQIEKNYKINVIYAPPYKNNVSFARLLNHFLVAKSFVKWSSQEPKPDIILSSFPIIELCYVVTRYGKTHNIPVVLDVRDMWPDMFVELAPRYTQWLARVLLSPYFRATRLAFRNATAVFGVSPSFVDWGVSYAGRWKNNYDRDFPFGYPDRSPDKQLLQESEEFWRGHKISRENDEFIICFFGTIGRQFDFDTVIRAAKIIGNQQLKIKFVLCGSGEMLDYYKKQSCECKNVIYPGWVGAADIYTLMRMSSIGLAPYVNKNNFMMNLTNKPIEYMSAGLPIVSSMRGNLENILLENKCGVTYSNGNHTELSNIIMELYGNIDEVRSMSSNSYNLYSRKYRADTVYGDMINHLQAIVESRR